MFGATFTTSGAGRKLKYLKLEPNQEVKEKKDNLRWNFTRKVQRSTTFRRLKATMKMYEQNGYFGKRRCGEKAVDWWYSKGKQRRMQIFAITAALSFLFIVGIASVFNRSGRCNTRKLCPCDLIVPDIIHFYRADKEAGNISNMDAACLKAALRYHGNVWIHTTNPSSSKLALTSAGLGSKNIQVMYPPRGPGPMHLAILREYGGIFLKNYIYIVDRLDAMRGHDLSTVGRDDIVAGTQEGALNGFEVKLKGVLLDKDYGALYISDVIKNCTYSAVRLNVR